MITSMEVTSEEPGVEALPIGGFVPNNAAIQIRSIDGLGPVKSDIQSTGYATGRGELSTGQSVPKRNLLLTLGLNPNYADQSVAGLRKLLYHYFMPGTRPHFTFITDDYPDVYIDGITESFEPDIFSTDPQVQISVLCLRPDFIETGTTTITGTIEAGTPETSIDYSGTVPVGFQVRAKSSVAVPSYSGDLTIRNTVRGINHEMVLSPVVINSTKYVWVETTKTLRFAHYVTTVGDTTTDILALMTTDSEWPELLPGPNVISILTDASHDGMEFTLDYIPRYGGL